VPDKMINKTARFVMMAVSIVCLILSLRTEVRLYEWSFAPAEEIARSRDAASTLKKLSEESAFFVGCNLILATYALLILWALRNNANTKISIADFLNFLLPAGGLVASLLI
jgi:hypothetical protein